MTEETVNGLETPVVEVDVEQPAAIAPEAAPEPETQPEPAAKHGNAGKTPWYMERISQESARAREALERVAAAERRAQEAEELARRLHANKGPDGLPEPRQEPRNDEERRAEIQREAQNQRFYEDTLEIKNKGYAEFGQQFGDTLSVLNALGATNNEFISDVMAIDKAKAHDLLAKIAKDPERAVSLTQMTSRQRIAELTRMTMADAKSTPAQEEKTPPAPKTTSKAPAPAPAVQPSASKVVDWRADDASDADFSRGFDEMMAKRNARR